MNKLLTKAIKQFITLALIVSGMTSVVKAYDGWADEYITFCRERKIMTGDEMGNMMPEANLTREQMTKMILVAFDVKLTDIGNVRYEDVLEDRWSYPYIAKYSEFSLINDTLFKPEESVTREEFLAMAVKISGVGDNLAENTNEFNKNFSDWCDIDSKYYNLIATGYENGCINGSDGKINPKSNLTRAEASSLFFKIISMLENKELEQMYGKDDNKKDDEIIEDEKKDDVFVPSTYTPIVDEPEVSLEQAKEWAKNKGAHERFIEIADTYWKYGEITGIRPDILYAQAAKETAYGKYGGRVVPEQNNWAGIKKYGHNGDETEDHEDFLTPDDGVRAHFNHISAYVGLSPVGEPHGRYKSVKSLTWAGSVVTVEELGGKWCPDVKYGASIIENYLNSMKSTVIK